MAKKTRTELEQHLLDVLERMVNANERFDAGRVAHAPQLATEIRILVHHAGRSQALLEQLGFRTRWGWFDEAMDLDAGDPWPSMGPVGLSVTIPPEGSQHQVKYVPFLGSTVGAQRRRSRQFSNWWERKIVRDSTGEEFSRLDLVKAVANQDGGAHVEDRLPRRFDALKNGGSLGHRASAEPDGSSWIELGGFQPSESTSLLPTNREQDANLVHQSPIPALIRQFSYELLETVRLREPAIYARIGE